MCCNENYTDIQKTQSGRLWSMLAVAPFLAWVALASAVPLWAKRLLVIAGVLTILTVGFAWYKTRQANEFIR